MAIFIDNKNRRIQNNVSGGFVLFPRRPVEMALLKERPLLLETQFWQIMGKSTPPKKIAN
jgi:hypothetical protein